MTDNKPMCARCMAEDIPLLDAPCTEKPENVHGAIGMYHCPDCGSMVLAGFEHPKLCETCRKTLAEG